MAALKLTIKNGELGCEEYIDTEDSLEDLKLLRHLVKCIQLGIKDFHVRGAIDIETTSSGQLREFND